MFITIINDCKDSNAVARQSTRIASIFNVAPIFAGVQNDLEAGGTLVDVLDASEGKEGIVLANVAPRNKKQKLWQNGTPFAYFYYKKTLIITTIEGYILSLSDKLGLVSDLRILDVKDVLNFAAQEKLLPKNLVNKITWSQFRSFDFTPRAARWIWDGAQLPIKSTNYKIDKIDPVVWNIDNFGNIKTTILPEDVEFKDEKSVKTNFGNLKCFSNLRDVPDKKVALIVGSSGIKDKRFLEIVVQGIGLADELNARTGDKIL